MKEVYEPVREFIFNMKNGEKITGHKYFKLEYGIQPEDTSFCYSDIDELVADYKYIDYDEPLLFVWNKRKYLRVAFLWENRFIKVADIDSVTVNTRYEIRKYTIRCLSNELDAEKFIEYVTDKHMEYNEIFREVLK